jgi:membrane protein implicated in regulation of membrane protease activity
VIEPTRNVLTGVMAIGATLLLGAATYATSRQGGWWWVPAVGLAILGVSSAYGVWESFRKVPRDEKGNRVK